jgi:hypothetical protein
MVGAIGEDCNNVRAGSAHAHLHGQG